MPKYTQIVIDIVTNGSVPSVSGGSGGPPGGASGGVVNAYAGGTLNFPGGWGLVGEEGPEMVRLPNGAQIFPAGQTQAMMQGGGGGVHIDSVYIQAASGDHLQDLLMQAQQLQGDA